MQIYIKIAILQPFGYKIAIFMVDYTFSGIKRVLSHDEFGAVVEVDAGGEAPRGLGACGVLHHRATEEVINRAFVGEGRLCSVAGLCLPSGR